MIAALRSPLSISAHCAAFGVRFISCQRASPLVRFTRSGFRIACDTHGNQCKQITAPLTQRPFYGHFHAIAPDFHTWELAFLGVTRRNRHLTRGSDARNASANARTPAHAHERTNARTNARAHAPKRGRTHTHTDAHAHTPAHAGAPAPAYARDGELAALQRALQVRCKRGLSIASRSERDAERGFA